jgi:hypothetical protein
MPQIHPAVTEKLEWFETDDLPYAVVWVGGYCRDLANVMAAVPSHPQLTIGLQHLIEARDCFIRAVLAGRRADTEPLAANPEVAEAIDDFVIDPESGFYRGRPR